MLYVQLDCNWPDNPKIIRAGWEAAGVHAAIMCLAKRLERDGWVHRALLDRIGAPEAAVDRLLEVGLLEVDGDRVRPWDWHDRNPSQAAIGAIRSAKVRAGKKGNHDRWQHPHLFDDCPLCFPNPQVIAGCESDRIADHRTPTKSESEVRTRIAGAIQSEPTKLPPDQVEANLQALAALKARRPIHTTPT